MYVWPEAHLRQAEGLGPKARERAKRARERSEQHSSEVYSSRTVHLPEAPKCIQPKCTKFWNNRRPWIEGVG